MERIKSMKECLIAKVQSQMGNLDNVDTKELGEAIDMIKDLADVMKLCEEEKYYKKVTKAMEENTDERAMEKMREYGSPYQVAQHYYTMPPYPYYMDYDRDIDRDYGRMYYRGQPRDSMGRFKPTGGGDGRGYFEGNGGNNGGNSSNGSYGGSRGYSDQDYFMPQGQIPQYPKEMRDMREGRSPLMRRSYMESKELHKGKEHQIQELEKYMQELSTDLTEMINDASPEEKTMLQQKLSLLVSKIK